MGEASGAREALLVRLMRISYIVAAPFRPYPPAMRASSRSASVASLVLSADGFMRAAKVRAWRKAKRAVRLAGTVIDIDEASGKARSIERLLIPVPSSNRERGKHESQLLGSEELRHETGGGPGCMVGASQ